VITVSANTDVSLGDGETVIAHSFSGRTQEGVAGDRQQQYVIVVTAHVAGSGNANVTVSHPAEREWHVFALQHSQATEVADILKQLIRMDEHELQVVVDVRTNSLFIAGPDTVLEMVKEYLRVLDGLVGRKQPETP
jgi:type II secretory pathway component GspD/PulD (secretin)